MDLHLSGKTAIVTGASKGIGLAVTRALAGEGVRVIAGARTAGAELSELTRQADVLLASDRSRDLPMPASPRTTSAPPRSRTPRTKPSRRRSSASRPCSDSPAIPDRHHPPRAASRRA